LVENLKTTRYQNGDTIGTTMPVTKNIEDESTPKYQWAYNGDVNNVSKYGRLYTWYAVNDIRKISPTGWHVPSDAEWTILENYLIANGYNYDGTTTGNKIARSMASTTDWAQDTETGYLNGTCSIGTDLKKNNASGFSALPGGCREVDGHFWGVTTWEAWWTSTEGIPGYTESFPGNAWYRYLSYTWNNLNRYISDKKCGNSIRCIKD
jgi:uncharacterized protein (TIGR02145 family)